MGFDLASITAAGVGSFINGIGDLGGKIKTLITGELSPEKQAEVQAQLNALDQQIVLAQIAVNLEEAKSESILVAGWRPMCGWVGAASLGYAAIIEPFMTWCARLAGSTVTFPTLNTEITMQILIGILGLGAARSYDKSQDPSPKGKE